MFCWAEGQPCQAHEQYNSSPSLLLSFFLSFLLNSEEGESWNKRGKGNKIVSRRTRGKYSLCEWDLGGKSWYQVTNGYHQNFNDNIKTMLILVIKALIVNSKERPPLVCASCHPCKNKVDFSSKRTVTLWHPPPNEFHWVCISSFSYSWRWQS